MLRGHPAAAFRGWEVLMHNEVIGCGYSPDAIRRGKQTLDRAKAALLRHLEGDREPAGF